MIKASLANLASIFVSFVLITIGDILSHAFVFGKKISSVAYFADVGIGLVSRAERNADWNTHAVALVEIGGADNATDLIFCQRDAVGHNLRHADFAIAGVLRPAQFALVFVVDVGLAEINGLGETLVVAEIEAVLASRAHILIADIKTAVVYRLSLARI
jgi:hypothetical protein